MRLRTQRVCRHGRLVVDDRTEVSCCVDCCCRQSSSTSLRLIGILFSKEHVRILTHSILPHVEYVACISIRKDISKMQTVDRSRKKYNNAIAVTFNNALLIILLLWLAFRNFMTFYG